MAFLARIVRFLFWLFVVSWSVWLLRRFVGRMLRKAAATPQSTADDASSAPGTARHLVRDPVCGMHVDETLSIPLRDGTELLHFCSIACREAYAAGSKKFAANG